MTHIIHKSKIREKQRKALQRLCLTKRKMPQHKAKKLRQHGNFVTKNSTRMRFFVTQCATPAPKQKRRLEASFFAVNGIRGLCAANRRQDPPMRRTAFLCRSCSPFLPLPATIRARPRQTRAVRNLPQPCAMPKRS